MGSATNILGATKDVNVLGPLHLHLSLRQITAKCYKMGETIKIDHFRQPIKKWESCTMKHLRWQMLTRLMDCWCIVIGDICAKYPGQTVHERQEC